MKKSLFVAAVATLALVACKKSENVQNAGAVDSTSTVENPSVIDSPAVADPSAVADSLAKKTADTVKAK